MLVLPVHYSLCQLIIYSTIGIVLLLSYQHLNIPCTTTTSTKITNALLILLQSLLNKYIFWLQNKFDNGLVHNHNLMVLIQRYFCYWIATTTTTVTTTTRLRSFPLSNDMKKCRGQFFVTSAIFGEAADKV